MPVELAPDRHRVSLDIVLDTGTECRFLAAVSLTLAAVKAIRRTMQRFLRSIDGGLHEGLHAARLVNALSVRSSIPRDAPALHHEPSGPICDASPVEHGAPHSPRRHSPRASARSSPAVRYSRMDSMDPRRYRLAASPARSARSAKRLLSRLSGMLFIARFLPRRLPCTPGRDSPSRSGTFTQSASINQRMRPKTKRTAFHYEPARLDEGAIRGMRPCCCAAQHT